MPRDTVTVTRGKHYGATQVTVTAHVLVANSNCVILMGLWDDVASVTACVSDRRAQCDVCM